MSFAFAGTTHCVSAETAEWGKCWEQNQGGKEWFILWAICTRCYLSGSIGTPTFLFLDLCLPKNWHRSLMSERLVEDDGKNTLLPSLPPAYSAACFNRAECCVRKTIGLSYKISILSSPALLNLTPFQLG